MSQEEIESGCLTLNSIIRGAKSEIEDAEKALKNLQKSCNHRNSEYHHRACAEDDCYYTCLTCGAIYE